MNCISKCGYHWQVLQEKDIHIWDGNASRDYLDRQVFDYCQLFFLELNATHYVVLK